MSHQEEKTQTEPKKYRRRKIFINQWNSAGKDKKYGQLIFLNSHLQCCESMKYKELFQRGNLSNTIKNPFNEIGSKSNVAFILVLNQMFTSLVQNI